VPDVNQRLALYRRLASLERLAEIDDLRAELADRFGPLPRAAEVLLDVIGLRVRARALGIERIEVRGGRAFLTFAPTTAVDPERLLALIKQSGGKMTMRREYTLDAAMPIGPWATIRPALVTLLETLR
jgi:transcription-repair coupling factor (superfamily II helicase)